MNCRLFEAILVLRWSSPCGCLPLEICKDQHSYQGLALLTQANQGGSLSTLVEAPEIVVWQAAKGNNYCRDMNTEAARSERLDRRDNDGGCSRDCEGNHPREQNMVEVDFHLQARLELSKAYKSCPRRCSGIWRVRLVVDKGGAEAREPGSRKKFPCILMKCGKLAWVWVSGCESLSTLQGGLLFVVEVLTSAISG